MKKFTTLLLAVVLTASLCFVGCKKPDNTPAVPESVTITNSSLTLKAGDNKLTAEVQPAEASQAVNWTIVGSAPAGVTLDGDTVTVSKNTADGSTVKIKAAAQTDMTVSQTKTFTVDNPPAAAKEITTEAQLRAIGEDLTANYKLMNDIELTADWKPLGKADIANESDVVIEKGEGFAGTLDGNGYTIRNLNIIGAVEKDDDGKFIDGWNIGFFYKIEDTGIIENLGFESERGAGKGVCSIGWNGVIAGTNFGTIRNCYTDVRVAMENSPGGALLGSNNGTIENCYAIGPVTVGRDLGGGVVNPNTSGFVNANNGAIYESYVLDTSVEAAYGYHAQQDEDVQKSRTWMRTAQNYKDAGWSEDVWYLADGSFPQLRHENFVAPAPELTITNTETYLDYNKADQRSLQIAYVIDNIANEAVTFALEADVRGVTLSATGLLSIDETVKHNSKVTVIVTSVADPALKDSITLTLNNVQADVWTEITTEAQLRAINDDLAGNYKLMNDITLAEAWTPIGTPDGDAGAGERFRGKLDGNGYAIKNFTLTGAHWNTGFICTIGADAVVEKLGLESGKGDGNGFISNAWNGALAGINEGTIRNCYTDVRVSMAAPCAAAFVGANKGTIENCYAIGKVTIDEPTDTRGSGFVNENTGTITASYVLETAVDAAYGSGKTADAAVQKSEAWMTTAQNYKDAGWSEDVWYLADGSFPQLNHENFVAPAPVLTITNTQTALDYNVEAQRTLQITYSLMNLADQSVTFSLKEAAPAGVTLSNTGLVTLGDAVENGAAFTVVATAVADTTVKDEKQFTVVRVNKEEIVEISTEAQFWALFDNSDEAAMKKHYRLKNDITLTQPRNASIAPITGSKNDVNFAAVPFTGIFDGNGYALLHCSAATPEGNPAKGNGIFGEIGVGGTVKNLTISVSGTCYVGSGSAVLAGVNRGTIENVVVIGANENAKIANGETRWLAGLVYNNFGTLKNCLQLIQVQSLNASGAVTTDAKYLAISNAGTIENCYVNRDVAEDQTINSVLGDANAALDEACIKDTAFLQAAASYDAADWSSDVWTIEDGSYPTLKNGCSETAAN